MTEHDIGKMITCTIDSMPVPGKNCGLCFEKILRVDTAGKMRITSYKKKKIVKWKQRGKKNEMQ